MNELMWACHVCGELRPDHLISVHSRTKVLEGGVEFQENVRYCNDRQKCRDGATDTHHTSIGEEVGPEIT